MAEAPQPTEEELARLFDTVVGTVTLRVGDLGQVRSFYERALGLRAAEQGEVVELADAEGRVLLRLDATRSGGVRPPSTPHTGLYHTAFRFPDRAALGAAVLRAYEAGARFHGASDHGVSEAVYLEDAEGNGIELYRDRPYEEWPPGEPGRVGMFTAPLDVQALVREAGRRPAVATCDVGHIHLMVSDVERTMGFYRDVVGLDERQRFGPSAIFLAEGLYHHHVGANVWHSRGAPPAPANAPGLEGYELRLRSAEAVERAAERLAAAGVEVEREDGAVRFRDPDSIGVTLRSRDA